MAKFLFIYRGCEDRPAQISPQEMQQIMNKWNAWIAEGMQKGWMLSPGDALMSEGKVVHPKNVVTDGPFVESKEIVGGYSVIEAETLAAATELAKGCPGLQTGGKVEVRPLAGLAS